MPQILVSNGVGIQPLKIKEHTSAFPPFNLMGFGAENMIDIEMT